MSAQPSPDLAFTQAELAALAQRILDLNPDPAPRCRVLRDLLRCRADDPALQQAEQALYQSRWVAALAAAQQPDGTWGRFHSQDSRLKGPFPTSEFAIRRALALGLDRRSPLLQKASAFIQAHLQGQAAWSDPLEKHDDPRVFPYNIRSVSAAMLALIEPEHALLEPLWAKWAELVAAAFADGSYDAQAELARHQQLSGIASKRLSPFHIYYPLLILSATRRRLSQDLEERMLAYLLHKPDGMYYVSSLRLDSLPPVTDRRLFGWLHGQEVLARFRGWQTFAPPILNGLWAQRGADGLWDPGQPVTNDPYFPLSENWRRAQNRAVDVSIRILTLLHRYFA